jgi:hypothetical protein
MKFKQITIKRTIIHKIYGKKEKSAPYAETSKKLIDLDASSEEKLIERIEKAINKSKRFFETGIEDTSANSFWARGSQLSGSDKAFFIKTTTQIAEMAAEKHNKGYIPSGLLIIIDSEIDRKPSVIVIKAELQEAFLLEGNLLKLIKELFLSPAAELYKMGILIQAKPNKRSTKSYESFVYDDHFNPKNDDLATYFYRDMLGLTTSSNDKLLTNNFYKDYEHFVDKYVSKFEDKRNLKIALKNDLRSEQKNIIDPSSYIDLFPKKLAQAYGDEVVRKFDRSFSKDTALVDYSLKNYIITITDKIKLTAPGNEADKIDVLDAGIREDMQILSTKIEAGTLDKIVIIESANAAQERRKKGK